MSFKVKFFQMDKKTNSTKLPDAQTPAVEYDCVLKDACTVLSPVIQLTGGTAIYENPTTYNYCYIADFGRFYFVANWTWSGPVAIASLSVDVLATYKPQIGAQSLYVTRSASNYDGDIIDTTYPTKTDVTFLRDSMPNPFAGANGVYVVGIVSQDLNGTGTVTYYALNNAGFRAFCQSMFSSISWMNIDIDEISEDLQKALVNPFQYVVSCMYLPINNADVAGIPGAQIGSTINFGFWQFSILPEGYVVMRPTYYKRYTGTISIPKHPQSATRGNYLNTSPYSSYTLAIYPFGCLNLDSTDIMDAASISYTVDLDLCTGRAICNLDCGNGKLRVIESQVGVTIPTTSIQVDWTNLKQGVLAGAAASVASTAGTGSYLQAKQSFNSSREGLIWDPESRSLIQLDSAPPSPLSNIASSALAAMARPEVSGQLGMQTGYDSQPWSISGKFLELTDEDLAHRGRPLCQTVRLDTLSGYVLVADGDFSIPGATAIEQRQIIGYLISGIFWE